MRISVAGLGRMGGGMARNLLERGDEVIGYDVNKEIASRFKDFKNFHFVENSRDIFNSDFVVLSLPTGNEVMEIMASAHGNALVLDTTTMSLIELKNVIEEIGDESRRYLTCRLERGPKEANEGKLAMFLGGDKDLYEKSKDFLDKIGEHIFIGNHEQATMMKLMSNMIGTAIVDLLGQMSVVIRKMGIDVKKAETALAMGGASTMQQFFRLEWQVKDEFGESFSMELAQHVIDMAIDSARTAEVFNMPMVDDNNLMMKAAMSQGFGKKDVSEISKMYWNINMLNHLIKK